MMTFLTGVQKGLRGEGEGRRKINPKNVKMIRSELFFRLQNGMKNSLPDNFVGTSETLNRHFSQFVVPRSHRCRVFGLFALEILHFEHK
jgi:hypothetical protein